VNHIDQQEAQSVMLELEGIIIDHYHIKCLLTQGGMSEIYLAQDLTTEKRIVAIKVVHNSNYEYYERFRHEVQTMSSLQHQYILPVLDYGEYESWYYLITPYISYGTLNDRLALGAFSLEEAGKILEQLADALQFAHEQGIIHRDIKPSNVLLRDGEYVYLADFGLAKRVGDAQSFTLTGMMMGTPDYMAPELTDEPASPRSDIYALGVLLYQMVTGKLPFRANTPQDVFLKHISEQPKRPSIYNPTLPIAVENVILQALQKDPHKRFSTAAEMVEAYQQALNEEPLCVVTLTEWATLTPLQVTRSLPLNRRRLRLRALAPLVAIGVAALTLLLPLSIGLTYYEAQVSISTLPQVSPVSIVPVARVTPTASPVGILKRMPGQPANQETQTHQQKHGNNDEQERKQQDNNGDDDDNNGYASDTTTSPPSWSWQNKNGKNSQHGKGNGYEKQ
jgi:serine/threonine protein kinase